MCYVYVDLDVDQKYHTIVSELANIAVNIHIKLFVSCVNC